MMLGKRGRPPMKRTTSMTEFTLDLSCGGDGGGGGAEGVYQPLEPRDPFNGSCAAAASPRLQRRNSAELVETAHFLRICALCKRRLVPGRDIYMYRGDSAFCSLECRQQQMAQDEWKEKCSVASKKGATITTAAGAAVPQVSAAGGTVAAV